MRLNNLDNFYHILIVNFTHFVNDVMTAIIVVIASN
jgi:hypothetical protein